MAEDRVTPTSQQAGFTIIEVMIAILITALTVIGVLGLFRIETRASGFSRHETEAAVLAQDKLEELRALTAPTAATTLVSDPAPIDALGMASQPNSIYTRSWRVDPTSDASVFVIYVVVSWDDDGYPRSVEVRGQRGST